MLISKATQRRRTITERQSVAFCFGRCRETGKPYAAEGAAEMEVITLRLDEIKPYANNTKEHPQEQIDEIKESIARYGMNDPIAVWGKSNTIVEGHGRFEALRQMGIKEAPCIRLDHLTDKQRREYTIAHNKTTMDSGPGASRP